LEQDLMTTNIPPLALERLQRLRTMLAMARAASDGFAQPIEHAYREASNQQVGFSIAGRDYGDVRVDEHGRAYRQVVREVRRPGTGTAELVEYQAQRQHLPQLDGHARQLHRAKERLAELRAQQAEAGAKAAVLRQAVEDCERALRERGWRERRA
jgi:hypothetical protein